MNFKNYYYLKESISPLDLSETLLNFLGELSYYQSNHYGSYDSKDLYNLYNQLNKEFKKECTPNRNKLKNAYRGSDSKDFKPVLSFTTHSDNEISKKNANIYGSQIFSLKDHLISYENALDVSLLKSYFGSVLWNKITNIYSIGDDENEILIFGGVWK
jgi:hypothetical protein